MCSHGAEELADSINATPELWDDTLFTGALREVHGCAIRRLVQATVPDGPCG